jgi:adenylate cyclase
MATARVERRLAAILAADVAGYSRLMGADEEGTLARLNEHLHVLIDPTIHEHRGRIVKTTGDGLLLEFASVVEAVRCAVAIQRGMAERNVAVPPEERIEFRIGVNVGDIIIEGPDAVFAQASIARLQSAGRLPTRALGNGPLSAVTTTAGITSIAGTPLISCSCASAFR